MRDSYWDQEQIEIKKSYRLLFLGKEVEGKLTRKG